MRREQKKKFSFWQQQEEQEMKLIKRLNSKGKLWVVA